MATAGFSVTDEQKAKVDQAAEQWIKDNGGSKSDFLLAMVKALESANAKAALAGRADEIEHVEKLLDGIRVAYLSSLSIAKAAKEEAATAAASEIERAKAVQNTLQETINNMKADVKAAIEAKEGAESRAAELETSLSENMEKTKELQTELDDTKADKKRLMADVERLEAEIVEMAELKAKAAKVDKSEAEAARMAEANEALSKKIKELEAAAAKTEKAHEKELNELQGRQKERLEMAEAKKQTEIDAVKNELAAALNEIKALKDDAENRIRAARLDEREKAETRIAEIRSKIEEPEKRKKDTGTTKK